MSWEKVKLGAFLENRDDRFKPNNIAIQGLNRIEKIDFSGNIVTSDKPSNTDMILVKNGDLVISGINVEKGAMVVYTGNEDITATIHYSSYRFDDKKIDIEFLKYFLKSAEFKQALKEQVPGGIKTEIKPKHLLPLEVVLPTDVEEQRKIISEFKQIEDSNQELRDEISHQSTLLKQLHQAFLREAMQGKLVEQNPQDSNARDLLEQIKAEKQQLIKDKKLKKEKELPPIKAEEIPFDIPDNWVWCRLGEISINRLGKMLDKAKNKGKFYPYLRNLNVQWHSFELKDILKMKFEEHELKEYSVKKGDLLICEGGEPGRAAIWELDDESYKFQKALHRVRFISDVSAKFYLSYLELMCSSNKIKDYFTGSGIQHFTGKSLNLFPIPLPPLPEQHRIVEKLDQLMQLCRQLEHSIQQSQEQTRQLLQTALREALTPKVSGSNRNDLSNELFVKTTEMNG